MTLLSVVPIKKEAVLSVLISDVIGVLKARKNRGGYRGAD
ncbi:hypothetical protein PSHT_02478, partial [Puccinia striiformis]